MKFLRLALYSLGSALLPAGPPAIAAVSTSGQAAEIAALEKKLAATRDEVTALKTALAVAKAQAQAAESRAQVVNRPQPELESLRGQVRVLERDLQSATVALKRVVAEKTATDSALEAARQQLAETGRGGRAQREPAAATATAAALNQKVAELQSALNETRAQLSEREKELEARGRELESLRAALAAAESKPSIAADDVEAVRRALNETERRLAAVTEELADSRRELATARKLEPRVRELEAEKAAYLRQRDEATVSKDDLARMAAARADAEQRLVAANAARAMLEKERDELRAQAARAVGLEARIRELESGNPGAPATQNESVVSREEFTRVAAAQVDAERKLATALRSYTLLARERDELRARVAELSARLSPAPEQR